MPKKHTEYDIKIILSKYNFKLYDNNQSYKNNKTKMTMINNEGFLYYTNIDSLISNYKPREFSTHNPYVIHNINIYIKNNNIDVKLLSDKYVGYDNKLLWECKCGNQYECSLHHFLGVKQFLCKSCSSQNSINARKLDYDYVVSELNKNEYTLIDRYLTTEKIPCLNKEGFKVIVDFQSMQLNQKALPFHKSNPYTIDNIKTYLLLSNINCELISDTYEDSNNYLEFKCHCGNIFSTNWSTFRGNKTKECSKCSIKRRSESHKLTIEEVKNRFKKRGYTPLFNKYADSSQKLLCKNKDGYLGEITLSNLNNGSKFEIFSKNNKYFSYNIKHFIKINNIKCELISIDNNKIILNCACGNHFNTTFQTFVKGKRQCDECSNVKSKYEITVEDWLNINNIKFINQYKFEDCRNILPLPFDFYLPDYNILIEVNGKQHYEPVKYWHGDTGFEEQKRRDSIKYAYCQNKNIRLIILPYWNFRKNKKYIDILQENLLGNKLIHTDKK